MTLVVKNPPANAGNIRDAGLTLGREDALEEEMATHSSILGWESHGQKSLVGYSPWSHKEPDMTEAIQHAGMPWEHSVQQMPPVTWIP